MGVWKHSRPQVRSRIPARRFRVHDGAHPAGIATGTGSMSTVDMASAVQWYSGLPFTPALVMFFAVLQEGRRLPGPAWLFPLSIG
jgi:hypothetical protein